MLVRYFTAAPGALSGLEKTFFFVLVNTYIHGRYTVSKKQCGKWHSKSSNGVHFISFRIWNTKACVEAERRKLS